MKIHRSRDRRRHHRKRSRSHKKSSRRHRSRSSSSSSSGSSRSYSSRSRSRSRHRSRDRYKSRLEKPRKLNNEYWNYFDKMIPQSINGWKSMFFIFSRRWSRDWILKDAKDDRFQQPNYKMKCKKCMWKTCYRYLNINRNDNEYFVLYLFCHS